MFKHKAHKVFSFAELALRAAVHKAHKFMQVFVNFVYMLRDLSGKKIAYE